VLGFRFGWDPPFAALRCGEVGMPWLRLAVRLLLDALNAMESASEPTLALDFCFAIGREIFPRQDSRFGAIGGRRS